MLTTKPTVETIENWKRIFEENRNNLFLDTFMHLHCRVNRKITALRMSAKVKPAMNSISNHI